MGKTGIIILAAGSSTRMGEPKQLMMYQNKTLLQHIIGEAKYAALDPIICVTGFQSALITKNISGLNVVVVYNEKWAEGMGSGIVSGIKAILTSDLDAVILAVSDQPYVSSDLFNSMIKWKGQSAKGIIASAYAGTLGTPVLFDRRYFNRLRSLNGHEGAKHLVKENIADVYSVEFEEGAIDIDTREDYEKLISENVKYD